MNSGVHPDEPAPHDRSEKKQTEMRMLGRYQIEQKLGSGGMGAVYRALDTRLKRTVALKVLSRDKARNSILVKRFQSEAEAAAQLRHDHIVGIYDSGESDGYLYIAMEFIDGCDAHEFIQRNGPFSVDESTRIVRQVVLALQHAYQQSIVHRDIKPSNLLIDRQGVVKLVDMGLARSITDSEEAGITRVGTTVGTIDYMPPEQARDSRSTDCRSDIYSLGATWYHLLTARPPFPKGDLLNKITAHATTPPPHPQQHGIDVPEGIWKIIEKMLAKDPADRFQTPDELLAAIDRGGLEPAAAEPPEDLPLDLLAALGDDSDSHRGKRRSASSRPQATASGPDLLAIFEEDDDFPATRGKPAATVPEASETYRVKSPDSSASSPAKTKSSRSSKPADPARSPEAAEPRRSRREVRRDRKAREKAQAETRTELDNTQSAIPSARDVALSRHRRDQQTSDAVKFTIFLIVAAVIAYVAWTALTGSPESSGPAPAAPSQLPG